MGTRYIIDTNIAIYFLDGLLPDYALPKMTLILNQESNLSIVSKIELLGWSFPNTEKANSTQIFVDSSFIFPLSNEVADKSIELRKAYKIKLPDAVIAATALVYDITLISRNDKDFANIPALKYYNPFIKDSAF